MKNKFSKNVKYTKFFTKLVLKDITRIFVEQRLTKICILGENVLLYVWLTDYDPLCKRKTGENYHILKYFFVI